MIICYIFPEIWHVTAVIISFHFEVFYGLSPSLTTQKIKHLKKKKKKKTPGDIIIILQLFTKNYDEMM